MTDRRLLESSLAAAMVLFGVAVGLATTGCDPGYGCVPDGWEQERERYKLDLPALGIELSTHQVVWLAGSYAVSDTFEIHNRGDAPVVLERAELILRSHTYDAHVGEATGELPTVGPGGSRSLHMAWDFGDQHLSAVIDGHPRFVLHFKVEFKRFVVEVPYTCSR